MAVECSNEHWVVHEIEFEEREGKRKSERARASPVQPSLALSFPSVQRQSIRSKPTDMRLLCSTEKGDRMSGIANLLSPGGGPQAAECTFCSLAIDIKLCGNHFWEGSQVLWIKGQP